MKTTLIIYSLTHEELKKYIPEYKYKQFPACNTASTDDVSLRYYADDFFWKIRIIQVDYNNVYFTHHNWWDEISNYWFKKSNLLKNKKEFTLN